MGKVKFDRSKFKRNFEKAKRKAIAKAQPKLKRDIIETIQSGRSPVQGQGKFLDYSDSYLDQIDNGVYFQYSKNPKPVNLTLSGDMLNSYFSYVVPKGLALGFDSEIATYHNRLGAGKSRVIRRILPKDGERFSNNIRINFFAAIRASIINELN